MVHVLLLVALSAAIGVGLPVAEARQHETAQRGSAHGDDEPQGRAAEGDDEPAEQGGQHGSPAKPAKPVKHAQHEPEPEPEEPAEEPHGEDPPAEHPTTPREEPKGEQPPKAEPSAPAAPATPTSPRKGGGAQKPGLVPVARLRQPTRPHEPASRPAQPRGGTLPQSTEGSTIPESLLATEGLRPVAELERPDQGQGGGDEGGSSVTRTVRDIVEVVPDSLKLALAALTALSLLLGGWSLFTSLRSRRLEAQRRDLLSEVGLLQRALLPPVPEIMGALHTSVAYRPADGVGAGGDFYDAVPLPGGRTAFILGDVSGHGRAALERTAFMRYTLRAYLEAGLEPRVVLQVAGRVIDDQLGGDFATVLVAVHDPSTGSLTYASAGHPAPIVVGPSAYQPVMAASSPPLGVGVRTGLRQTTLPLAPGSVACLYTDGLTEARTERGLVGRGRLSDLVEEVGDGGDAEELLRRVAEEARVVSDDMAACLLKPTAGVTTGGFRTEQLELSSDDLEAGLGGRFLRSCGLSEEDTERTLREAAELARPHGGAVLHVGFGNRLTVEVLPRNVESIEAASVRAAAAARG